MKMLDNFFGYYLGMGIVMWIVFIGLLIVTIVVKLVQDEKFETYLDGSMKAIPGFGHVKLDWAGVIKLWFGWPIMIPKSAYIFKIVIEQAEENRRRDRELAKLRGGE